MHHAILPSVSLRLCAKIVHMAFHFKRHVPWAAGWLALSLLGCLVIGRAELARQKESFDAETQVVHRLLSQAVTQVEAVLSTLPTLPGLRAQNERTRAEQRLLSVFPHVLMVLRRDGNESWSDEPLRAGEAQSRRLKHAVLADVNLAKGRYHLVLAQEGSSYALLVDVKTMIPWQDWPMSRETSPVRVSLALEPQVMVLQEGKSSVEATNWTRGWTFESLETLSSSTQPFSLITKRHMGWGELRLARMAAWCLAVALMLLAARALLRQRHDRHRAEALLRVGQVGRLNTLSELANGMVQELGEPMHKAQASTQAAQQLLRSDLLNLQDVQAAVGQAAQEVARAADVVNRLRHVLEQPDLGHALRPVSLLGTARSALDLISPELQRLGIKYSVASSAADITVTAEPVALGQIIHNLLMNAVQALQEVRPSERSLVLTLSSTDHQGHKTGQLSVQDSGPGIANDVVTHIFKPFFTTRAGALGLGLSLSETLANSMGGSLTAYNRVPRGAEFCLTLPLAA
jgi:signal transduction histidine kinase